MRKLTPRQYAQLLYNLTLDCKKNEAEARIKAFANYLIKQRATMLMPRIRQAFLEIWNLENDVVEAEVTSARKISSGMKTNLTKALGAKKLEIKEIIDSKLIAGARFRIGDTVIDGTLKGHLESLRKHLYAR